MTDDTRPTIVHAPRCQRRGAVILRASWQATPEVWCPDCDRYAPAPDTESTNNNTTTERNRP